MRIGPQEVMLKNRTWRGMSEFRRSTLKSGLLNVGNDRIGEIIKDSKISVFRDTE